MLDVNQLLHDARSDGYYLGNSNVKSHVRWIPAPDHQSEVLVTASSLANSADPVPLTVDGNAREYAVLKAIVLIQHTSCFITRADCHYNPDQPTTWQQGRSNLTNLLSGNGSMVISAVPESFSPALHAEWATYVHNITEVVRDPLPCYTKQGFIAANGQYKLTHSWWDERDLGEIMPLHHTPSTKDAHDENSNSDDDSNGRQGYDHTEVNVDDLDLDRDPPFRTINAPVRPTNLATLRELAKTHSFNPLCAYMQGARDDPLHPSEYATTLPGAIAQVTFTLSHKIIRRPKPVSHFTATIDEIEILQRPVKINLSPLKSNKKDLFRRRESRDNEPEPSSKRVRVA